MRLERADLLVEGPDPFGDIVVAHGDGAISLKPEDLRWLCLIAGPAFLNELGKEATHGN